MTNNGSTLSRRQDWAALGFVANGGHVIDVSGTRPSMCGAADRALSPLSAVPSRTVHTATAAKFRDYFHPIRDRSQMAPPEATARVPLRSVTCLSEGGWADSTRGALAAAR